MKVLTLIISFIALGQISCYAQDDFVAQGFKIGITPSALFNSWLGYQGKVSYTTNRFEIEANIGYIGGTTRNEPYSGYRFRPVGKYYFSQNSDTRFYVGFGGLYRKIKQDARGTFGRFNNSFFQELDFELSQRMAGLYGMVGALVPIHNDRFFFEVGLGIGRSRLKTEHFDIPDDATLAYSPPIFTVDTRSAGTKNYPIFFLHWAFMYRI